MSAPESSTTSLYRYGGSFLHDAVQSFQQEEKVAGSPRDKLRIYLRSDTEQMTDVIQWWSMRIFVLLNLLFVNTIA